MKLKDRLDQIRSAAPNGPTAYGQLYADKEELRMSFSKITLWSIWQSEEGGFLVRGHVFESKKTVKSPAEWSAWFDAPVDSTGKSEPEDGKPWKPVTTRLKHIHSFIGGKISERTGDKQWTLIKVIGWVAKRAFVKSKSPRLGKGRSKASKKGRARG